MYKYTKVYSKEQELQIAAEFQRLKDICYLDHAGATLYSEKQMSNILSDFSNNLYGNPHSNSTFSKLTHDSIDQVRYQILNHFNTNTDEYSVIFTNGATGALKLVSESFNYNDGYFVYLQDNHTSVLDILAIKHGFDTFKRLNLDMDVISKQTFSLARYVYYQLIKLHHFNNEPVVVLYHDTIFEDCTHQGGIINFNLRRSNGEYIGYAEVLHIANLFGIQLRTGCFCNPGSCQRHLNLTANEVNKHYEKGHVCGDQNDLIEGVPTGSVRISFGYMSNKKDADEFLNMIKECFLEMSSVRKMPENFKVLKENYLKKFSLLSNTSLTTKIDINQHKSEVKKINNSRSTRRQTECYSLRPINGILENVYIYPLKSCGAFEIHSNWQVVPTGLQYDREWMIVDASGVCLTQKRNTNLCKIKPYINLKENKLELHYEDLQKISVPLLIGKSHILRAFPCRTKVCGDPIVGWDCGEDVATPTLERKLLKENQSSIERLQKYLVEDNHVETIEDLISRFRPNLVVNFEKPFIENDLIDLNIADVILKASGKCARCQIICVDQNTGEKSVDLLRILSKEFHGQISFGMYLRQEESDKDPHIGVKSKEDKLNTNPPRKMKNT
ncbi:putative sulfurates the molybdenum cofactor [Trypoxylus dichotomus]